MVACFDKLKSLREENPNTACGRTDCDWASDRCPGRCMLAESLRLIEEAPTRDGESPVRLQDISDWIEMSKQGCGEVERRVVQRLMKLAGNPGRWARKEQGNRRRGGTLSRETRAKMSASHQRRKLSALKPA